MAYFLGIDLGTTFSAAAIARGERVDLVTLGDRSATIPSVVFLREDGEVLVGEAAERRSALEPTRVAREFKRRLGDPTPMMLGSTPYGAEALSAQVLRAIVARVTAQEGEAPTLTVITHPANYGPYKRDLLRDAARQAELGPFSFLTEPEAAAIHYAGRQRLEPGEIVCVYDLGGGTFDSAVLRKTPDLGSTAGFELIGTPDGIDRLGGIDFDQAVFSHVERALGGLLANLDPEQPNDRAATARLREECRNAKEALSTDSDVTIQVLLPNVSTEVRLTRREFEAMVRPRLQETVSTMQRAVRSAGISIDDVARILLVGGSSRIPLVSELLREATGRPVAVDAHPKFAIAGGAAMAAADPVVRGEAPVVAAPPPEPPATPPPPPVVEPPPPPEPPPPAAPPSWEPAAPEPFAIPSGGGSRKLAFVLLAAAVLVAAVVGFVVLSGGDKPKTLATSTDSSSSGTSSDAGTTTTTDPSAACPRDAERFACITQITLNGENLVVAYDTGGYTPSLQPSGDGPAPGSHHIHFFFDNTKPEDAGTQSNTPGVWRIWAVPSPYTKPPRNNGADGFIISDIPQGATKMCSLVADSNHAVTQGTGNCIPLPAHP